MKVKHTLWVRLFVPVFICALAGCALLPRAASPEPLHTPTLVVIVLPSPEPSEPQQASANIASSPTPQPSLPPTPQPLLPSPTFPAESPTPAFTATLFPKAWRVAPVIPTAISPRMQQVYNFGQTLGNNPRAFSKVGDCQSMLPDFMGDFDNGRYSLGEYAYLQEVVDNFSGSFGRQSRAVKTGMTASGAMATLWNTWKDCNVKETPLECEYRINQPSFAFISLGTNDANGVLPFEDTLRKVIETTLEHGIVPILVTKADNAEGDWSINVTIMQLAYEYELPVWNFWLAVQPLPLHGLRSPEHLTYGEYVLPADFSPENMQYAYNVRNLTALQVLDVVWRSVTGLPPSDFTPTPVTYLP